VSSSALRARPHPLARLAGRARAGFSLIEMLVVALIMSILLGLLIGTSDDLPTNTLQDGAAWLSQAINAVREEAILRGQEARVHAQGPNGDVYGRFIGTVADPASPVSLPDDAAWIVLPGGSVWGHGPASVGPLGDVIVRDIPSPLIRCDATGDCDLGGAEYVTYYMMDSSMNNVVRAVTLSRAGNTRVFRYNVSTGGWE
jgi:prepilin-type N-terminal cleavage/methylation domain-containing protein